jgi:hypothetical protein
MDFSDATIVFWSILNFVERVENNIVVVAGHMLTISRPKRKVFMEALTKYIGEV